MVLVIVFLVLSVISSIVVIAAGMLTSRLHRATNRVETYQVYPEAADDGATQRAN